MASLDMNRLVQESMSKILESSEETPAKEEVITENTDDTGGSDASTINPTFVGLIGAGVGANKYLNAK